MIDRILRAVCASLVAVSCAVISMRCALAEDFEQPPTFQIADTRAAGYAKGPHYKIDPIVPNDGNFNHYMIRSDFGNFEAVGQPMLEARLSEIPALAELNKLSSSKVFVDAASKAGEAALLSPITAAETAYDRLSDPDKAYETVKKIPEGAGKLFRWAASAAEGVYGQVAGVVSGDQSSGTGKSPRSGRSGLDVGKAARQGQSAALDLIGYSKRERDLFKKLGVNPYSSNQTLVNEVERVAGIETAVGTAFRFVPSVTLLREIGTFNRWYSRAEDLALYEAPKELAEKTKAALLAQGIPEPLVNEFMNHEAYSPWTRRLIADALGGLGRIPGRSHVISAALQADDEPSTLYFVSATEMLRTRHASRKFERIVSSASLPAGVHPDGLLYLPMPVDYLVWTKQTASILRDLQKRVARERGISKTEIEISGSISPRAKAELTQGGVTVIVRS